MVGRTKARYEICHYEKHVSIGVCSALRHGLYFITWSSASWYSKNGHDPKCLVIAVTFYKRAARLRNQAFTDIGQPKRSCTSLLEWLGHLSLKISPMGGLASSITPFVCTKLASCGGGPYALHSALWNMRGIGTYYWSGLESGILKLLRRPVHRVQTRETAQWPCSVVFFGLWSQESHLTQCRTPQDVVCIVFF